MCPRLPRPLLKYLFFTNLMKGVCVLQENNWFMLEVYEIKKERYFIEFTSLMVYFLDLQSALTEMNTMNKT